MSYLIAHQKRVVLGLQDRPWECGGNLDGNGSTYPKISFKSRALPFAGTCLFWISHFWLLECQIKPNLDNLDYSSSRYWLCQMLQGNFWGIQRHSGNPKSMHTLEAWKHRVTDQVYWPSSRNGHREFGDHYFSSQRLLAAFQRLGLFHLAALSRFRCWHDMTCSDFFGLISMIPQSAWCTLKMTRIWIDLGLVQGYIYNWMALLWFITYNTNLWLALYYLKMGVCSDAYSWPHVPRKWMVNE